MGAAWSRGAHGAGPHGLYDVVSLVLFYLDDEDIFNLCSVSQFFVDALRKMNKRRWKLRRCYLLDTELYSRLLTRALAPPTRLDLSYCHWMTEEVMGGLIRSEELRHLDLTGCIFVSHELPVHVLQMRLDSLAITWSSQWCQIFQCSILGHPVYHSLKRMRVQFPYPRSLLSDVQLLYGLVLPDCHALEHLTLYEPPMDATGMTGYNYYNPQFELKHDGEQLLPRLKSLSLDFHSPTSFGNFQALLRHLVFDRANPLDDLYLGHMAFNLLNEFGLWYYFRRGKVRVSAMSAVCLSDAPHHTSDTIDLTRKWEWPARNCRRFEMRHVDGPDLQQVAQFILNRCNGRQIEEIDFKGCRITFANDETTIDMSSRVLPCVNVLSANCRQLTSLDLSLHDCLLPSQDNELLISGLSLLKELRSLRLSSTMLAYTKTEIAEAEWEFRDNAIYWKSRNITATLQHVECCPLWRVSQVCTQLKLLHITYYQTIPNRLVPDCTLMCLSNWSNLKELSLVNVPFPQAGFYLNHVARKCANLEVLFLHNIYDPARNELWSPHMGSAIEASLDYLHRIRDLTVIQPLVLTSKFVQNLSSCKRIERIRLENFHVQPEVLELLAQTLVKLDSLSFLQMIGRAKTEFPFSFITTLDWLKERKSHFSYQIKSEGQVEPQGQSAQYSTYKPISHALFSQAKC